MSTTKRKKNTEPTINIRIHTTSSDLEIQTPKNSNLAIALSVEWFYSA